MEDTRALEIIKMASDEESKACNFRNLYQEVADYMYPCENQIISQRTPGEDKSLRILDPTPMFAVDDMVGGLIGTWIPSGQNFFGLKTKSRVENQSDRAMRYLSMGTEIGHEEMFDSNFMLQLHDTVKSLVCFGTGNLYTEWDKSRMGLNYKDWHISTYTIKQNARGLVDTVILTYELTARQASDEFANPGEQVLESVKELKTESKKFKFIQVVRPRIRRNQMLVDNLNMPFENVVVNVKEKAVVYESGYEENPFAVPRWEKSSVEKYGRGRGTIMQGGMPSGHTAIAFALATAIVFLARYQPTVVILSFLLASLVAESRLESRIHSVIEVLAGAAIGILLTTMVFQSIYRFG